LGCDIHENVEYIRGNKWVAVSNKKGPPCYFCNGSGKEKNKDKRDCYFCKGSGKKWYIGRNYMLFGILAGVRWNDTNHIPPKGLPPDVSKTVKNGYYEGDDHSASYFSLKELFELKEKVQVITSYVDMENYIKFKKEGLPKYWDDNICRRDKLISNEEMERRINLVPFWDGERFFTQIVWELKNSKIDSHFWSVFVPAMEKLHKDPEKVRFVFWFDN